MPCPPIHVRHHVRATLSLIDPELPQGEVRSMDDIVAASFGETRILTQTLSLFATLTLVLGALGVYGTLAFEVSARRKELGIRSALAARPSRLVNEVIRDGLRVAGVGTAVGLLGAYILTGSLSSYIFEVGPRDPVTFISVPALLLLAAIVASDLPARRAAAADPVAPRRGD